MKNDKVAISTYQCLKLKKKLYGYQYSICHHLSFLHLSPRRSKDQADYCLKHFKLVYLMGCWQLTQAALTFDKFFLLLL